MNTQCIEQALKVIPSKQLLVNMVSKRVRQLMAGSRPLIETETWMGLSDIALLEIANNHIVQVTESALA
jgi:DNA-directed RNA polymerase subunit omega